MKKNFYIAFIFGIILFAGVVVYCGTHKAEAQTRSVITPSDLTWLGQAKIPPIGSLDPPHGGTSYMGPSMAVRYINGTRYLYTVNFVSPSNHPTSGSMGDIVEWKFPTLYQGAVSGAPNMIPTGRVWSNWIKDGQWSYPNAGIRVGGLWFDTRPGYENLLWYVFYDYYGNNNGRFLGATILNDDGSVGTQYGCWYFRAAPSGSNDPNTYWKGVAGWIFEIPAYAQSAMGKMGLGSPALGVIGAYGNFGPGLRTLPDFPSLNDPPGSVLTDYKHIIDYSQEYGPASGWAMRRDANYTSVYGTENFLGFVTYINNTYTAYNTYRVTGFGGGVPSAGGDILYLDYGGAKALSLYIHMDTPSVGASRVWEYFNGFQWVNLNPTFNIGSANLDNVDNNGYWTSRSDWAKSTIGGINGYFIRIRNTATATTAGVINDGARLPNYVLDVPPGKDREPASGGLGYMQASRDNVETFVWVDTGTKHGVLSFGRKASGNVWYGPYPAYSTADGVASNIYLKESRSDYGGNGYHTDSENAALYIFDPNQMIEVANGTRAGNNTGINAISYDWHTYWPYIPNTVSDQEWISAYQGNGGYFDSTTNQIIWLHPNSYMSGYAQTPTVQVFSVGGIPTPPPLTKQGDLNNDGKVDIFDYNILIGNFGRTGTGIVGDINSDGKVDIFDYNLLVGNFGK